MYCCATKWRSCDVMIPSSSAGVAWLDSDSSSESGSHAWKMVASWASVLKSRIPCPRSLMPGFRIHHSWTSGGRVAL